LFAIRRQRAKGCRTHPVLGEPMKKILTAVMLAVVAAQSAHAAIATPGSGNGELFFVIHNPTLQVSFTKDLGIGLETFLASGSDPSYSQAFNIAADANWGAYQTAVGATGPGGLAGSFWAVMAFDATGSANPNAQRLLTTSRTAAGGFEATAVQMRGTTNQRFSAMINNSNVAAFFDFVNQTGSHGVSGQILNFAANGSSVNSITDPFPRAYFGQAQALTPSFNALASFSSTSAVGEKALFAYMTRSGLGNGATAFATVTPFGNADVPFATWEFDGQTLAYAVPEPSTYALLGLGLAGLLAYTRRRQAV